MTTIQFNILLGFISLLGYFFLPQDLLSVFPKWSVAVFFLGLYCTEYWSFLYKIKSARVKQLFELTKGDPTKRIGELEEPGCMMFYAFLIRFVFRFAMVIFVILYFSGIEDDQEIPNWGVVLMIVVVLFELFNLMYSMFELHVFRLKTDDDDEIDEEEYWLKERKWRTKMFNNYKNLPSPLKLILADFVLFLTSTVATMLFWQGFNQSFIEFIQRSSMENESSIFVILVVLVSSAILCLFFLMPIKLAFWIEQKMHVDSSSEKRRYRLSILFAGISITAPSWLQLIKTYMLGM